MVAALQVEASATRIIAKLGHYSVEPTVAPRISFVRIYSEADDTLPELGILRKFFKRLQKAGRLRANLLAILANSKVTLITPYSALFSS